MCTESIASVKRRVSQSLCKNILTLYFATKESESQNLYYFKKQVAKITGNELFKSNDVYWLTTFKTLIGYKTQTKKIVFLDKFSKSDRPIRCFRPLCKNYGIPCLKMRILCWFYVTLVSLMKSQTLDYSSPLSSRQQGKSSSNRSRSVKTMNFLTNDREKSVAVLWVTGGVPKYIEMFCDYTIIYEAIEQNALNSQSFLYEQPYFFSQKEVSEISSYFSLIKAIAMINRKFSDIATNFGLKQTGLTNYLKVLMDLDFLKESSRY